MVPPGYSGCLPSWAMEWMITQSRPQGASFAFRVVMFGINAEAQITLVILFLFYLDLFADMASQEDMKDVNVAEVVVVADFAVDVTDSFVFGFSFLLSFLFSFSCLEKDHK